MIEAKDIQVVFNPGSAIENKALRGMNLQIPESQFVTVIGSNGAGKSTFLNVLAGEIKADAGSVKIDEQDVTNWSTAQRSGLVARVFQDPMAGTCESLTIEENLALASGRGQKRGFSHAVTAERRELFREKISVLGLGLENRLEDKMGLLSGGQRQAVSLVMATLNPMKILLLDEHTAALDPKTAAFVLELTEKLVNEGQLTTMMVTHSMRQALDHGQRTVMLHEGRVVLDVEGDQRKNMKVEDLLHMFEKVRGEEIDDDKLLLS
ncbi:ABC transporter ATP-binding protein [Terasakiella brassicae]|uniref:ABC transporter ATP-binding protein n=1 Tax=Terasakiella brassicae TaxID=1634917 RepID=A0A917FAF0_9PROT|nr:ABC transporter ATP-binding protein [Terasakiella brassicae]GGF62227.1 ABC transporter ATP-binding protein [Terasakiella brassicae]